MASSMGALGLIEDRRVTGWFLMSSVWPTLYLALIYLALIYGLLPTYMRDRKPFKLNRIIQAYNIFQVIACVFIIYWIATSGWVQGRYSFGCVPFTYPEDKQAMSLLKGFHLTYFLKAIELIETIFFALRKKYSQITKLHVYHHVSTMLFAWFGCKYTGTAMPSLHIMLNSFIHILMYTYYFLSCLGPKWQKRLVHWKSRLTMAQMVQFTILIIHIMVGLQPSCPTPKLFLMMYLPNVILIFKMFYDFYKKSYTIKSK
ncbi:elongation of very long chain fatty acids protein AAEL008004-like [Sitophilus oryzae]|uniref:Elongation of very long chain fatty acids protein n=1 Tax=Sitophilus oryzae TaxID=7048 RepID=A0A6J2YC82_SITOR|nr:elongation of very long chain fatty acids protein AAEL008004-like [Sitophilus oryzae]